MNEDLRFIGIGSAFNPALGNTNAYFVHKDQLYLVDCGISAFAVHARLPQLRSCREVYVVLTHLHNDHAGSLGTLISYCYYELDRKIHVVHPKETVKEILALAGIEGHLYHCHNRLPPEAAASFEAFPVGHVPDMDCFGYVIGAGSWTVYFSGDAMEIPPPVLERFRAGQVSRIYQDTSLKDGGHHGSLAMLERLFPPEERDRVFCVHLECGAKNIIAAKGFQIPSIHQE